MNLKEVGLRIRKRREARSWRMINLADKSGLSVASLSRVENGLCDFKVSTAVLLAEALDMSVDFLLKGDGQEQV